MAPPPSTPAINLDAEHPWPGLVSYTESQRVHFYGRTGEIDTLFRHMRRRLLTVLFGQSGLGKSSLLQAGLFPRLRREGFLPIYLRLDHAATAPPYSTQIQAGLVQALADAGVAERPADGESLWEFFHRRPLDLRGRDGLPVTPVFVFDQFEEIFTLNQGDAQAKTRRGSLLTEMADLVENRAPASLERRLEEQPELSGRYEFAQDNYRFAVSLREDYLPHFEGLRRLVPSLMQNRMRLERMNGRQALDAVLKPGGHLVTPPVAESIVRFVAGIAADDIAVEVDDLEIEPPLLSLVCHELNNQRLALGHAQITADLLAGSSTAILRDFYERSLADQPTAVRRFVEDDLLTDSGFRENVALERARKMLAKAGAPPDAIARLVDRRLLHIEERLNLARVELTHDVLAGVVRASRDSRRVREEKETSDQRALEAERRERDVRRHLWLARLMVVVTVLLLIAAVAGGAVALVNQRRAARAQGAAQSAEARAREDEAKFRRIAIQADYTLATTALDRDDAATAIAYLRRILRTAPDEPAASGLLWSMLRDRNWCLPLLPPATHDSAVNTVEYSPDGTELVTASKDGTARLWNARTGAAIGEPMRHEKAILKAVFSPDGVQVATGSDDGAIGIWNARTGNPLIPFIHCAGAIADLAYSPDGKRLATGSYDHLAGLWDTTTGRPAGPAWPLKNPSSVDSVCFSPDGSHVVIGSDGGVATIHDALSGEVIGQPMRQPPGSVVVACSPDGKFIATTAADNAAHLWDAQTGSPVGSPLQHKFAVISVSFSPDGRRLLTCSNDMTAVLWDVATGKPVGQTLRHANFVWRGAFSPDGLRVLTTSLDGTARLWDTETGKPLSEPMRHQNGILYGAFSPDGQQVATASLDHTAQVWDTRRGSRLTPVFRHAASVRDAAFSPDGRIVATASNDHTAHLWDAATGRSLSPPLTHDGDVVTVTFSPDGQQLLTASVDHTARVWSTLDGKAIGAPLQHDSTVAQARFSPDGRRILTSSDERAHLWDASTHQRLGQPMAHDETIFSAVFSPDGKQVATASADGSARFWDALTGTPLSSLPRQDGVIINARYNRSGTRLLTACFDGNAFVWDAHNGTRLLGPLHHDNSVWGVAFSPDDKHIVTTSFDRTARLWDAATGKPTAPALRHGAEVSPAEFTPDGRRLATASFDGTARLWDVASGLPFDVPLAHDDRVYCARFNSSATLVLTASRDHTARLWDVRVPVGPLPSWLLELAGAVGGKQLNDDDTVENLPTSKLVALRAQLATRGGTDDFACFARWFFADRAARTVSPFLSLTVPDLVALQVENGTLRALKEACESHPCDPLALARLGRVEPNADTARFYARFAQLRAPQNAAALAQAALVFDGLNDGGAAARAIESAVQLTPGQASYRDAQGKILWRAGDHEAALRALDEAVKMEPGNAAWLVDRSFRRALSGDGTGAQADLDAALRQGGLGPELHNLCGWTLVQLGSFEPAVSQFRAASGLGRAGVAACAWHVDLKDQAVKTYLSFIQDSPAFGRADHLRAEMSALGLPEPDLVLLETVRAATLEKHPEFKK